MKSFPHARPSDEEVYALNIAVILLGYPQEVGDFVTAPGTGIQAQIGRRFPPTPGEVREACDDRLASLFRHFEHQQRPKAIEQRKAEAAAAAAEREQRPSYDELKARFGPNWGLKTTDDVEREERRHARQRQEIVDRHNEVAREWAGAKEPPTIAGITISHELAAKLERQMAALPPRQPKED